MRDMLGTRLVLFFFNPEVDNAKTVGIAVQEAAEVASDHNFRVIGVGTGSSASTLSRFAEEQGYTFPVLDDSSGRITKKLRLQIPVAILGIDADGYVSFGLASFAPGDEATASARDQLRPALRIGDPAETSDGELLSFPEAPQLNVVSLASGDTVSIESLRGKAAIVIFFLHTCPHCHHALEAIEKIMKGLPDEQKPELVAISVQNSPAAIRKALADLNLDFFTPYLDPGGKAAERWGVTGGVPVVTVIDAEGRIRHRSQGWSEKRDGGMLRMRVAAATGANVPMLLNAKGFTGNDACGVCHEQEYATWQYTKHATAFDTLVTHGADRRKDCVGCHVVGYEEKGGYDFATRPAHLEDVGCESCHGRGGPHLSPTFVPVVESGEDKGKKDYAQVCSTCHNPTHSLGFEFDTFHPLVSHATIAGMSNEERAGLLEGGPSRDLLPTSADHVGSLACQSCHTKEFETWGAIQEYATWQYTKHATAFDTLVTHGADRRKDCVGCHVVGYEEKGGYDFATRPAHLEDVGCESCHGRGGPHLSPTFVPVVESGEDKGKKDYAQVCSTCHNPTHSLGFEFDTFHPLVSHATIAGMSNEERAGLLEGGPSRDLLPTSADHVGSLACQSCHTKEFETWKASPHAHAVATLEAKGEATNTECLQCHTTAYGKPGGFPEGAKVADHGDLASVGCESCHGPGGDHIGENAKRVGTILSLGDKCDSCAILKVCGSCHDDANDPGFQFEVEQRINDQRHGTIESAATRAGESAFHMHDPEDTDASRSLARAAGRAHDRALLRHALDHTPAHGAERDHSETSDTPGDRG